MDFGDTFLICKECNEEFIFTAGERDFYLTKNLTNLPARCSDCRNRRKQHAIEIGLPSVKNQPSPPVLKEHTMIACAKCGKKTTVPFRPQNERPAYCKECYVKLKANQQLETAPELMPVGVSGGAALTSRFPVHLLNRLFDPEASALDRRDAALELGHLDNKDPLTQVGLLLAVENKEWMISWAAIESLANIGDTEALKYLEQKLNQNTDVQFSFLLNNALQRMRKRLGFKI